MFSSIYPNLTLSYKLHNSIIDISISSDVFCVMQGLILARGVTEAVSSSVFTLEAVEGRVPAPTATWPKTASPARDTRAIFSIPKEPS